MTFHDLTVTPNAVQIELVANTGLFQSPLIGAAQTVERGGMKWRAVLSYINLNNDKRAELMALIAELRGQANRMRVPCFENPKRGAYGGTPLVAGASQTGNTLNIDGASASVTNWIRRGDYFSVEVNGEHELKLATADANSDGLGNVTLTFEPRLRASPADNAVVFVEDGVLSRPQGIFVFEGPANGWAARPGVDTKLTTITLNLIEDIFAAL